MHLLHAILRARSRYWLLIVAIINLLFWSTYVQAQGSWFLQVGRLRPDESKFIRAVLAGDEETAVALTRTGGVNPSLLAGQPLSGWFYSGILGSKGLIDQNVHRIVFQTFRQDPNPPNIGLGDGAMCRQSPSFKWDTEIAKTGTPEQKDMQSNRWRAEWVDLHAKIAASFQSLLRYGLRDRQIITAMFQGCFDENPIASEERYDVVLRPMLKAGANINMADHRGMPPIERAIVVPHVGILTRLLEDGARADVRVPANLSEPPGQRDEAGCAPRLERSVFKHVFRAQERYRLTKGNDPAVSRVRENFLTIVKLLAKAGLSPMREYGSQDELGFDNTCRRVTLYGEIAKDDIPFAEEVKAAALSVTKADAPSSTSVAALPPVAAKPAAPQASRFGDWNVATGADGRYFAVSKTQNGTTFALKELRIECVAGGRLEYVPVASRAGTIQSMWIDESMDAQRELKLVNGRATAKDAAALSKMFMLNEAAARQSGAQNSWAMPIVVNGADSPPSMIGGAGFSQMRNFLLSNCKG